MNNTVEQAAKLLINCFQKGNKLMLCGNGGSAADCAHISGELCKGFLLKRKLSDDLIKKIDTEWAEELQQGLPAINLTANTALITAIINDIGAYDIFAQQVLALGKSGDVLMCISTSGNAENVLRASKVAKALNIKTIGLTGKSGGKLKDTCDLLLNVDATETYLIQEQHIKIYHRLCILIEEAMFE
ncbi:MAG: D-sedoheptulose-7-phosphate isomerase [Christensenellales bacterium]|jgi:D-sedoheptulose 7-phosphate isomerase